MSSCRPSPATLAQFSNWQELTTGEMVEGSPAQAAGLLFWNLPDQRQSIHHRLNVPPHSPVAQYRIFPEARCSSARASRLAPSMSRPTLALRPLCQKRPKFFELWLHSNVMGLIKRYWPSLLKAAHLSSICRRGEGVDDAPSETNFKTKASKQGPAGIGGCRIIIVTRKRRVRSP